MANILYIFMTFAIYIHIPILYMFILLNITRDELRAY